MKLDIGGEINWSVENDGRRLVISVDQAGRQAISEAAEEEGGFTERLECEVLEPLLVNSPLGWVDPADTGDLTSAPILGIFEGAFTEDQLPPGNFGFVPIGAWPEEGQKLAVKRYTAITSRWGYPHYQLRSFLEDLATTGKAEFIDSW